MLTDEQLAVLPGVLREIVETDRKLGEMASSPVVALEDWRYWRSVRTGLSAAASSRYSPGIGGGNRIRA